MAVRHTTVKQRIEAQTGQPLRTYLMDAYLVQGLSTPSIGRAVGVNSSTVVRWLAQYGIPARPRNYAGRSRRAA